MEGGRRNERKTIYKPVHDARSRHSQVLGRTHRQTAGCSAGQTDTDTNKAVHRCPEIAPPGRDAARRQAITHVGQTSPSVEYVSKRRRSSK